MLIFLILVVLVFLGFYYDKKPEKTIWVCSPQSLDTPSAKPFNKLNTDSQAFVLEQSEEEKNRFESVHRIYEQLVKKLNEQQQPIDSQQQQTLEDLSQSIRTGP